MANLNAWRLAAAFLIVLSLVNPVQAGARQFDQPRYAKHPASHTLARAGQPQRVRRHSRPTYTREYDAGWVGGGAGILGDSPRTHEGVWGRDYVGLVFPRCVWPHWLHGRREQGGSGAYKSDGPRLIKRS
ncbi:MAG TPA: hypothetical protein VMV69_29805 [Pirellulales bacterium]|nr:hypothetical protein [Pirellulales bacterium]